MIKYKNCNCEEEYWEEIIVNDDDNYRFKTVMYFHCSYCSVDFRVEDFYNGQELFYNEKVNFELN